jgi:ribonucleoside-triphosphate reductase
MNLIGRCVVAGNVRRTAEIALGSPYDTEFLDLKNGRFPERKAWSWLSNNSVMADVGQDYSDICERTWSNGEPGFIWLENIQNYERMNKVVDTRDSRAIGVNPCGEQPLEDRELCTLTELYLPNIPDRDTLHRTIKHAYRYGKIVTLASGWMNDDTSAEAMQRNRRIGLSVTGVAQFVAKHGEAELVSWLNDAYGHVSYYDKLYSQWYKVPQSIRMTSVKPSGTLSTMAGVTPGAHYSVAGRYYTRRITISASSPLVDHFQSCGYTVEPSLHTPGDALVCFPVDAGSDVPAEDEVSLEQQIHMAQLLQRYWSGNAVSFTGKFDPKVYSPGDLARIVGEAQHKLKTLSLLPLGNDVYPQMPYEKMTPAEYGKAVENLQPTAIAEVAKHGVHDKRDAWCESDRCEVSDGRNH